jgi:ERCC4-type nuclease
MRGSASVIIDSREPLTVQAAALSALASLPLTPLVTCLETGDFVIRDGCTNFHGPCLVAIERKRVSDFLGSFRSGRLEKQLTRLKHQYTYPILLIEGELKTDRATGMVTTRGRKTKWSHASVQMYLWSLQRREGINVLYTHDIPETADLVRAIARRAVEGCVAHLELARTG